MATLSKNLDLQTCPHCAINKPLLTSVWDADTRNYKGGNHRNWKTYVCSNCGGVVLASARAGSGEVKETYPSEIKETYDFEYLPDNVREDFEECLTCYSSKSYNAFAAMARRTVQSSCTVLGSEGKDKVLNQLKDLKEMSQIDDETFDVLKQIIIAGHDGAHPYLPKLSPERAAILLELMKDVLFQLFIRKAKIKESIELRKKSIENKGT